MVTLHICMYVYVSCMYVSVSNAHVLYICMYLYVYVLITVYLYVNVTSLLVSRAPLAQALAY